MWLLVLCELFLLGVCSCGFDLFGFNMGGCFRCFRSSNEEGNDLKEEAEKDSVKEGSTTQSHYVNRVSSGRFFSLNFL